MNLWILLITGNGNKDILVLRVIFVQFCVSVLSDL